MTMILIIMMMMAMMMIFMKHPLSMGLILMLQTISVSLYTGMMINEFWYSYILFMIMIGGMLVLLLYMTSIMSNEKFHFSWKLLLVILPFSLISLLLLNANKLTKMPYQKFALMKIFQSHTNSVMILLIIFLFVTLIAVVMITKTNFGPLRKM